MHLDNYYYEIINIMEPVSHERPTGKCSPNTKDKRDIGKQKRK